MPLILQDRWEQIQNLHLKAGGHNPDSTFCVMEAAAYVAGEPWSDSPKCVPETLAAFFRTWNDELDSDEDRDRLLKPFIPRIIGLRADEETENRRALMCGNWALHVAIPEYLRAWNETEEAERLEKEPEAKNFEELEASAIAIARAVASASAIAIARARASASASARVIQKRLEESQSALVERMIECGK